MDYHNPQLILDSSSVTPGEIAWKSPSNIALVKYWGKHGVQLPRNPSISLTLDAAHTETRLRYDGHKDNGKDIDLDFRFEGQPNEAFAQKIVKFLRGISEIFPFVKQFKFTIDSKNSFPHSSGIASSASSMSALALCLCSMESKLFGTLLDNSEFRRKASYIARLGSGSASRSIFAHAAVWGGMSTIKGSSDLYAIPYQQHIHEIFHTFRDDILIVSQGEKAVSSRMGHALMDGNDYAPPRYKQAQARMVRLLAAMKAGDLDVFGGITESEAMTLHALMMTSSPAFTLMKPNTLEIINRIQAYRRDTRQPVYFSLDAGPNIHLLYPEHIAADVAPFIDGQLLPLCENNHMIADKVGLGPLEI